MSKHLRTLAVGAAMVGGLAAVPVLYAQDYLSMRHGSMMGQETMGQGGMMSGMMGMSGDISGTGDMMERCNEMMQAMGGDHADRPNDQWRSPQPEQPGRPQG